MKQRTPGKMHDDMDFGRKYSRIRGSQSKGVQPSYCQDFKYYDGVGEYIRDMPAVCRPKKKAVERKPVPRNASSTDRPQTAREAAIAKLGNTDPVPKSIKDARKENRAAAAAEANAE